MIPYRFRLKNSCNKFFWTYNNQTYLYSGNYQTIIENNTTYNTIINLSLSILETNFFIPNTFTPNLDRKNEVFKISTLYPVENYEIWIYNRWGEQIFHTDDIEEGWDGFYEGRLCQIGVYAYKIKYDCFVENTYKVGSFILVM